MYSTVVRKLVARHASPSKVVPAASTLYRPVAGAISDRITRLTSDTIQEISRPKDDYKIDDYFNLLKNCPVINSCYELKALRCAVSIGKYTHQDDKAEKWVHENEEQMEGTMEELIGHGSSASFFGNFVAEIVFDNKVPGYRNEWRLQGFRPLDPRKVKFMGTRYGITHVAYQSGGQTKYIPYGKVIHVVADHASFGDPYGIGLARRAMPWFKSKQLLMSEWVVSGLNQARGLLLGFADSNQTVQLYDATGNPMVRDGKPVTKTAVESLLQQMMNLESSSMIATDLNNRIEWRPMPTDANFFQLGLQFINRQLLLSQLVPSLTFEEGIGGIGNSGIANVQQGYLDSQIEFITDAIKDQLIDKVWRKLLNWNFGYTARQGWGEYVVTPNRDPNIALAKANAIVSGIVSQIFPSSDPAIMNKLRELLDLPLTDEKQMLDALNKQLATQAMQANATAQQTDPNAQAQQDQQAQSGFSLFYP
ncbi:MAG TPA: hypothetical protein V6C65_04260 [Allocoleopsis sp.]